VPTSVLTARQQLQQLQYTPNAIEMGPDSLQHRPCRGGCGGRCAVHSEVTIGSTRFCGRRCEHADLVGGREEHGMLCERLPVVNHYCNQTWSSSSGWSNGWITTSVLIAEQQAEQTRIRADKHAPPTLALLALWHICLLQKFHALTNVASKFIVITRLVLVGSAAKLVLREEVMERDANADPLQAMATTPREIHWRDMTTLPFAVEHMTGPLRRC